MESDPYPMNEGLKEKRIMVVDDESDLTLLCKMLLEFHGFEVGTFNDPKLQTRLLRFGYSWHKIARYEWL
jgi:DNA-binding NtrC family response regulator